MKKLIQNYHHFKNTEIWRNPLVMQGGSIVIVVAILVALYALLKRKEK